MISQDKKMANLTDVRKPVNSSTNLSKTKDYHGMFEITLFSNILDLLLSLSNTFLSGEGSSRP